MAVDNKEILLLEAQFVDGKNPQADVAIDMLKNNVDYARKRGWLRARLPQETKHLEKPRELLVMPELEFVVARHVERNILLGFHEELGKSADKYRSDFILPEGADQLVEYAGDLDVVLVVEPRIPLQRKHELARKIKELDLDRAARDFVTSQVNEYINTEKINDLTEHPQDKPYVIFTHDGQRYRHYSLKKAIELFSADEIGAPQTELTDLYIHKPSYFIRRGMWAGGSRYEDGYVPYLGTWCSKPGVRAFWNDNENPNLGVLSRGKKILEFDS